MVMKENIFMFNTHYILANTATVQWTLDTGHCPMHAVETLVILEGSRLSQASSGSCWPWPRWCFFWPRWCFFWPPCYFSAISMSRSTRCHCITLQICVEAIQLGAMHSKACLRVGCSAVEQCRDWWSIDGVRSGENYTKISLRCCRARGQGDRGGTRSLAGGMN